jgi:lysophospholipase L1-like esterase
MRRRSQAVILTIVLAMTNLTAEETALAQQSNYADPARFEDNIREFEAEDAKQSPPRQAVLCVGSSTMRMWHAKIREDLAPLTVVARGFGGSTMNDLLYFSDRIVIAYQPRAILIYEGDNDVAQGVGPQEILGKFQAFVAKVHERLPETRIYFMAIKPSHKRWSKWPTMTKANRLVAAECARDKRLHYVDIARVLLDDDGNVRREFFEDDDLHLNRTGYERLRDVVRPILLHHEQKHETQASETGVQ